MLLGLGGCLTSELLSFLSETDSVGLLRPSRAASCLDTFLISNEDGKILKMATSGEVRTFPYSVEILTLCH